MANLKIAQLKKQVLQPVVSSPADEVVPPRPTGVGITQAKANPKNYKGKSDLDYLIGVGIGE